MFENYLQKKISKISKIFGKQNRFSKFRKIDFRNFIFLKIVIKKHRENRTSIFNFENQKFQKYFVNIFEKNTFFLKKIIFEHNFLHHKIIFFVLVFFPDKVWVCIFSFWHLHTPTTSLELRTMGIDLARIVPSFTQLKKNRCYIYHRQILGGWLV